MFDDDDDETFDHIILWTVLLHIPREDHGKVMEEAYRLLKPNGILHIFDNNPAGRHLGIIDLDPRNLDYFDSLWHKLLPPLHISVEKSSGF